MFVCAPRLSTLLAFVCMYGCPGCACRVCSALYLQGLCSCLVLPKWQRPVSLACVCAFAALLGSTLSVGWVCSGQQPLLLLEHCMPFKAAFGVSKAQRGLDGEWGRAFSVALRFISMPPILVS
jgi:hypothetical protein